MTFTNVPDPLYLYVFWPPGSVSGSFRQRYGSEDPDPYQNVTDHTTLVFSEHLVLISLGGIIFSLVTKHERELFCFLCLMLHTVRLFDCVGEELKNLCQF